MRRGAALAAIVVLAATGCAASAGYPLSVGALGTMGDEPSHGRLCLAMERAHRFTIGWETVTNDSDSPVTVDSVSLTDPQNLTLTHAVMAPIPVKGDTTLIGTWRGDPPYIRYPDLRATYESGTPANGTVIKPGEQMNVVLGLATDTGGESGPVQVTYHDADGDSHVWVGGTDMLFPAGWSKACEKAMGPLPAS